MTEPRDLAHLERCVALAAQALEAGDDPFDERVRLLHERAAERERR